MKILKQCGIYFALVLMTVILSIYGYVSESRKKPLPPQNEITYTPEKTDYPAYEEVFTPSENTAPQNTPKKTSDIEAEKISVTYTPPVTGMVSLSYSETEMIYSKTMDDFRTHTAADYICNENEPILSCGDGTVSKVFEDPYLGLCVHITHPDGVTTKYCSLSLSEVKEGENVTGGSVIGIAGSSAAIEAEDGVHLHFEAEKEGKRINPLTLFPSS